MPRVDCHLHTRFSPDSHASVERVVAWALRRRLDGIAVTDHDTMAGVDHVRRAVDHRGAALTVIPGIEVTTTRRTHLLGYFITRAPRSTDLLDVVDEIHDQGGVVAIAHPYRRDTGLLSNVEDASRHDPGELERLLERVDLIELSNAKSRSDELTRLLARLADLPPLPFSGGSDAHSPYEVGRSHVEIRAITPDGLRAGGIVEHRAYVGPDARELQAGLAAAVMETRRRLFARVPPGVKVPWRTIKREINYRARARRELEIEAGLPVRRWRRDERGRVVAVTPDGIETIEHVPSRRESVS